MRHFRSILIPAVLFLLPGYASAGWVQQQSGTTAWLNSVYFINPQTGWAVGDSSFILRTTDGGSHWERHLVDPSVIGSSVIWFWDSSLGFVAGIQGGAQSCLYKSSDGGLTWRFIPQSFNEPCYGLVFTTPQKGWLVGYVLATGDGASGSLYQTSDGGESWIMRESGPYAFRDVAFADSLFGWYTADNHAIFNSSNGYMKQTTDGGSTWQTVGSGMAYGTLHFTDPFFAWRSWRMFVPPGPDLWGIEKTTDRGVHWSGIYYGEGYIMPPVAPVDTLKGWIMLYDSLMGTRDGGTSWLRQQPAGGMRDIFFTDSLNGWIVGYNGLILHTTDGGSGVWEDPAPLRLLPKTSCLTVAPNPFTIFARIPGHSSERFALYDVSGRKVGVYRGDRIGEGLRAGVYFMKYQEMLKQVQHDEIVRIVKVR